MIEELGTLNRIEKGSQSSRLNISARQVLTDVKIGDSIAVNGVCLTVVQFTRDNFWVDVMAETVNKTTLKYLQHGNRVNLERAVRLGDRMGGHIVQGHIDGIGTVVSREKLDIAIILRIKAPPEVIKYTVPKGSIAIDGISLTVVEVQNNIFTVSLIPHTAQNTTLDTRGPGDLVNLESDIIGRYVEKLIKPKDEGKENDLSIDFLNRYGFL
ncbi:MAG: riboflavin synthase [Syntrophomonadaceae bacterium]